MQIFVKTLPEPTICLSGRIQVFIHILARGGMQNLREDTYPSLLYI